MKNLIKRIIKWGWYHKPMFRGRAYEMVDWERMFWKSLYKPIDEWRLKNTPIIADPKSRTIRLVGPSGAGWEGEFAEFAGRYFLDYRFFVVRNSLSDLARQRIAREIHDDILYKLRTLSREEL